MRCSLGNTVRLALGMVLAASPGLHAQNSECVSLGTVSGARQACNAAIDFIEAYQPLAGLATSGGNQVLGSPGAFGRLGAVSLTLRVNALHLSIPDFSSIGRDGTVAQLSEVTAPAPLVEAAVGLWPGLQGGLLALDVLGSAQLIPNEKAVDEIRVDPDAPRIGPVSIGLGIGARVGVLAESAVRPGVAVSMMRRSIPRVGYGNLASGDEVAGDVNVVATVLRATAGKRIGLFSLLGGAGWSRYGGTANAEYNVGTAFGERGSFSRTIAESRSLVFAGGGVQLGPVMLAAEIGHQFGRDQSLTTTFEGFDDTAGTTYFSAGLRGAF